MRIATIKELITKIVSEDEGAVTVDWVVLTAGLVLLGVSAAFYLTSSVPEVAAAITNYMDGITIVPD